MSIVEEKSRARSGVDDDEAVVLNVGLDEVHEEEAEHLEVVLDRLGK